MPAIFITVFAWIIGIGVALYLGTSFGDSDYLTTILASIICGAIAFVCWLHRYTLVAVLAILFFGFQFYTFGFNIKPEEMVSVVAFALMLMYIWQPEKISFPEAFKTRSFKLMRLCVFLWCGYLICHAAIHLLQMYFSHASGIRNVIKSYYNYAVPYILLSYFMLQPQRLRVSKHILTWIVGLCFIAIIVNAALRYHQQLYGIKIQYMEDTIPEAFYIPYLNLVENIYALRLLGPFSALLGMIIITSRSWSSGIVLMRTLGFFMIIIGIFGSLISGGRAAVLLCFIFIFLTIFLRKKYMFLTLLTICGMIFIGMVNVYSVQINSNLPFFISRSLQLIMFDKKTSAISDIESSSKWRNELHMMAIDEWRKSPKNMIVGRGFLGMEEGEDWYTGYLAEDTSRYLQELSVRRVTTHAMLTDLLLSVGVIGTIIYYTFLLSMASFCWKTFRAVQISETSRDISLILLVSAFSYILIATIAEGILNSIYIWLLITLCASLQAHSYDPTLPLLQEERRKELSLQERLKKASLMRQSTL